MTHQTVDRDPGPYVTAAEAAGLWLWRDGDGDYCVSRSHGDPIRVVAVSTDWTPKLGRLADRIAALPLAGPVEVKIDSAEARTYRARPVPS